MLPRSSVSSWSDAITWPEEEIDADGHDKFHFRNDREDTYKTVHEISELAQKGCVKCFLVYHSSVKVLALSETQQKEVKVFWNIGYPEHHSS